MPRTTVRSLSLISVCSLLVVAITAGAQTAAAQQEESPATDGTVAAPADSAGVAAPVSGATPEENEAETATGATAGAAATTGGATTGAATTGTAPAAATTSASTTTFAPAPEETAAAANPAPEEAAAAEDSRGTFAFSGVRLGASLGGGFFVGSVSGGMGGLGAGIGAQFGPLGFMYKFHFFSGYFESGGFGDNFYAAWNTIIVDYKFLRIFQIGIGPSMDFVWNCAVQACRDTGPYAGLEARFAVKLGPIKVGVGIHPTFFPGGALNTMFIYFGL
ncbi:MAG: hypothetical protein JRH11_15550 [Deltaproteobacteria bacterium]|nr:hypothetical protein [Deltaproteobacteria bacterium]